MAKVELRIGGRAYEIACRDGEEAHFEQIAAVVDAKAADAVQAVGGLTETRLLLFAALLLADDLSTARAAPLPAADPRAAAKISALAERVELLAARLERGPATP